MFVFYMKQNGNTRMSSSTGLSALLAPFSALMLLHMLLHLLVILAVFPVSNARV